MTSPSSKVRSLLRPLEPAPQARAEAPAPHGQYPRVRMRRNRADEWSRRLVAENRLSVEDMIWPVFVHELSRNEVVASMPGVSRLTVSAAVDAVGAAGELGIPAVAIFPVIPVDRKTPQAEEACDPGNLDNRCNRAIRAIKKAVPDVGIICDVALDPYTSHGHDGVMEGQRILNDETIEILCNQALAQAAAGVDIVAPSDMMDGRVGRLRDA